MPADALSDMLRTFQVRHSEVHQLDLHARQAARAMLLPAGRCMMQVHMLAEGSTAARVGTAPPLQLAPGDTLVLPHGDAVDQWEPAPGSATAIALGLIDYDIGACRPVIEALPRLLHVPAARGGSWLGGLLRVAQAAGAGAHALRDRVCEALVVNAIHCHAGQQQGAAAQDWMGRWRDRRIAHAIALMHERPAEAWSVAALAKAIALSRSAFAQRFMAAVGQPPIQYLAARRIELAGRLLRREGHSIAAIALEVGYESEAAFSRAFKRAQGVSPAAWRKREACRAA